MLRRVLSIVALVVILGISTTVNAVTVPIGKRTTYLTFNTPFALPGVSLPPGTYIFERAAPESMDIVRVMSRDRQQVYLTAFTRIVSRPHGVAANRQIVFGEVRQGLTPPVTAWYPLGEATGNRFIYPEGSRQLGN